MATNATPQPTVAPATEQLTPEQIAERIAAQTAPQSTVVSPEQGFSVQLDTGQIYRGKTKDELIQELVKAQTHSSKRITELTHTPSPQVPATPVAPTFDQQKYYQMLAENPIQAQSYALQFTPEAIAWRERMEEQDKFLNDLRNQTAVNQFKAEAGDVPVDSASGDKFEKVWDQFNLPITVANLKLVHAYCLQNKIYEPYQEQQTAPIQQMTPLPSLSAPGGGNATQQIDPNTMTADQLKQVIQALNNQR